MVVLVIINFALAAACVWLYATRKRDRDEAIQLVHDIKGYRTEYRDSLETIRSQQAEIERLSHG